MMQQVKKIILQAMALVMLSVAAGPALPVPAYAAVDPTQRACDAIQCNAAQGPSLSNIVKSVVNILSVVLGVIAVIMIIIAGLKYTTSGGDASSVSSAKNTLIYALVGIVIAAFAQFLARFALGVGK